MDETMLHLWNQFEGRGAWPFEREAVLERLRRNYEAAYEKYGIWNEGFRAANDARLAYLKDMPPLPPQFAD